VVTRICVCLSEAACPEYHTDPDVPWGSGRGCPLVAHFWVDFQSGHGLHCYGNIMRTQNISEYMLVLTLCLVYFEQRRKYSLWWIGSPLSALSHLYQYRNLGLNSPRFCLFPVRPLTFLLYSHGPWPT